MSRTGVGVIAAVLALAFAAPVMAQSRTPLGAETAGNAAGTIPAWDGGLTKPIAGFKTRRPLSRSLQGRQDPLHDHRGQCGAIQESALAGPDRAAEEVSDLEDERLSDATQRRRTRRASTTRRRPMRRAAKLAPGGNGVTGARGGIPFPAPKDGLEAIWNSTLRYRGDTYAMKWGAGGGHARGRLHDGQVRLRVRLQLRQPQQARQGPGGQQARLLPADGHRRRRAWPARSCWCTRPSTR